MKRELKMHWVGLHKKALLLCCLRGTSITFLVHSLGRSVSIFVEEKGVRECKVCCCFDELMI